MSTPNVTSRKERIQSLLKEINPSISISGDALELLDHLASNFVFEAINAGSEKASKERSANDIKICDLREFVHDSLNLDVVGFAQDDLTDETSGSRMVLYPTRKRDISQVHTERLAIAKKSIEKDIIIQASKKLTAGTTKKKKTVTVAAPPVAAAAGKDEDE